MSPWLSVCVVFTIFSYTAQCTDPLYERVHSSQSAKSLHSNEGIPGHLKPLGSHRPPEGDVTVVDGFIDPEEFFVKYVQASKPVLFKGAAKEMAAYTLWNDEYMNSHFGDQLVEVEEGKKENRSSPLDLMTLSQFLGQYQTEDIYLVQDVLPEMSDDLGLPRPLLCGGFQNVLQVGVLWFSSGGTKSVLHLDEYDNINCLIDGSKEVIFIDKAFHDLLEQDGFEFEGSYSQIDVDKVDMHKFPAFQKIPWWRASMHIGDCLYLPYKWFHTVESAGSRNLAVNIWFHHLLWFNNTDCEEIGQHGPLPSFGTLSEHIPETAESLEHSRVQIFEPFTDLHNGVPLDVAMKEWKEYMSHLDVMELFQMADVDKDLVLSWEEIYTLDMETLLSEFPMLNPGMPDNISDPHDEL